MIIELKPEEQDFYYFCFLNFKKNGIQVLLNIIEKEDPHYKKLKEEYSFWDDTQKVLSELLIEKYLKNYVFFKEKYNFIYKIEADSSEEKFIIKLNKKDK